MLPVSIVLTQTQEAELLQDFGCDASAIWGFGPTFQQ